MLRFVAPGKKIGFYFAKKKNVTRVKEITVKRNNFVFSTMEQINFWSVAHISVAKDRLQSSHEPISLHSVCHLNFENQ